MTNSYQRLVKNKLVTFAHQGNFELPDFKTVTSVAAIPFTKDGRLVVVDLFHRGLDLPGGHVEPGETSPAQTMRREVMEEASMTVKNPVLVEVIESNYFDDHSSYMLLYGVYVDELLDFVVNDESSERVTVSVAEFIQRYEAGDKVLMKKAVDDAWTLLNELTGEYKQAIAADKNDTLTEWLIEYLNDSDRGRNAPLASGLAEDGQFHTGLIDYPIDEFTILMGPDHSYRYYEDPVSYDARVQAMVESLEKGWKPVPFIASDIWNEGLELNDGAHRAEALKRFGIKTYPTVFYFKNQLALDDFLASTSA